MSETIQRYEPATGTDSTMRRVTFLSPHPQGQAVLYAEYVAALAERDRLLREYRNSHVNCDKFTKIWLQLATTDMRCKLCKAVDALGGK